MRRAALGSKPEPAPILPAFSSLASRRRSLGGKFTSSRRGALRAGAKPCGSYRFSCLTTASRAPIDSIHACTTEGRSSARSAQSAHRSRELPPRKLTEYQAWSGRAYGVGTSNDFTSSRTRFARVLATLAAGKPRTSGRGRVRSRHEQRPPNAMTSAGCSEISHLNRVVVRAPSAAAIAAERLECQLTSKSRSSPQQRLEAVRRNSFTRAITGYGAWRRTSLAALRHGP